MNKQEAKKQAKADKRERAALRAADREARLAGIRMTTQRIPNAKKERARNACGRQAIRQAIDAA